MEYPHGAPTWLLVAMYERSARDQPSTRLTTLSIYKSSSPGFCVNRRHTVHCDRRARQLGFDAGHFYRTALLLGFDAGYLSRTALLLGFCHGVPPRSTHMAPRGNV